MTSKSRFSKGESIKFLRTKTSKEWEPAQVTEVDTSGRVMLDVQPGKWFDENSQLFLMQHDPPTPSGARATGSYPAGMPFDAPAEHSCGSSAEAAQLLYVDEDAGKYYYHIVGSTSVCTKDGGNIIEGFREEEQGATLRWDGDKEGFEDDKLCRVRRANENPVGMAKDCTRESFLRKEDGTQQFWFEIACRFGTQLTIESWSSARDTMTARGRRIVKLAGFDGGKPLTGVHWGRVSEELSSKADVIIWDGDWYSDEGWTRLIPEFLRGGSERIAVAFQKQAEVPGFHRQYWHLYKEFPGRIWMVVLDDDLGSLPKEVSAQLRWLEDQVNLEKFKKYWVEKYVGVAMRGRGIQGPVPVIAINGGGVAVAQAAIELMRGDPSIPWTVFPAQRVGRTDDPDATLMGFLHQNPGLQNATILA